MRKQELLQILNCYTQMEYSQICSPAPNPKFAPDSSFFIYFDDRKLYIKDCSLELKNMGTINAPAKIFEAEISDDSKYLTIFMSTLNLIQAYRISDLTCMAKIQDCVSGIVSHYWVKNSLQLLVFSDYLYKVSVYNLMDGTVCFIKNPKSTNEQGFSYSSDGKLMALLQKHDCKDYLSVYYTKDWALVNRIQLDLFDAAEVKWTPNDAYYIVWDSYLNYRLIVHSHMLGQMLKYEPYKFALGIRTVRMTKNSLLLAIGSYDEKIRLINGLNMKEICQLDCSNPVVNSEKIMVHKEEETNSVDRMKCIEDKVYKIPVKITPNQNGIPNQGIGLLEFSEDDEYLACRNDNMPFTVWVWKISVLEPVAIITSTSQIKSIKWTKKENYLCITNGTDRILFWRINRSIAECVFSFHNGHKFNINVVRWSNDGKKALLSCKSETVYAQMIPLQV